MGDRLATIDMSRKERGGLLCPFPWGDLGPRLTQCGMGWGPVPLPKRGTDPPMFGPCLLWPNGCINQDATWYGGRPRPGPHCCRWQLSCPPRGTAASSFRPMSIVAKRSPISQLLLSTCCVSTSAAGTG